MSKPLKILFFFLGLLLFAWALKTVQISTVVDLLIKLGYGYFLILIIYGLVTYLDTLAWSRNFKPEESRLIKIGALWKIRQIGEAYNTITPLGTLGGEPVKAQLIKDCYGLSLKQGLASLVVARTTFLTGLILFFIPGIFLIFQSQIVPDNFKNVSLAGMGIFTTLIFLFFLFQITGILSRLTRKFHALFKNKKKLDASITHLEEFDELMSEYYRKYPMRAMQSIGYAFIGWVVGLGELYITLYFLGYQPTWQELWIIEALAQLVRVGSFFIPLSIGAQEGGLILIFSALGMPGHLGLTVSFVRRIKELTWVGLGLILGWALAFKPSQIQPDASEG